MTETTLTPPNQNGWSRLNVFLHWLIVALILVQYLVAESMQALWDATEEGRAISQGDTVLGWTHIVVGSVILIAVVVRLLDRWIVGRPPHPDAAPGWSHMIAKTTHALIYAIILAMPVLGLLAWFTGSETFANLHTLLWTPLLVLIALHVLGALAQHFVYRSDALARMTPGLAAPRPRD